MLKMPAFNNRGGEGDIYYLRFDYIRTICKYNGAENLNKMKRT